MILLFLGPVWMPLPSWSLFYTFISVSITNGFVRSCLSHYIVDSTQTVYECFPPHTAMPFPQQVLSICWPELHPKSYRINSILVTLAFKTFHNDAPYSAFSTVARLSSRNLTQGWFLSQQADHHLFSGSHPQKPKVHLSHEPIFPIFPIFLMM